MSEIKLTNREKEIVKLVIKLKTNKEICSELGIEKSTLETHMKNIHLKINAQDKVGTALWGINNPDELK